MIGKQIKERRVKARLLQKELASMVGIDSTKLSKIENGIEKDPGYALCIEILEAIRKHNRRKVSGKR